MISARCSEQNEGEYVTPTGVMYLTSTCTSYTDLVSSSSVHTKCINALSRGIIIKLVWTEKVVQVLLQSIVDIVRNEKRAETSFKKEAWIQNLKNV